MLYFFGKYKSTLLPNLIMPNLFPLITFWDFFKSLTIRLAIKPAIWVTMIDSFLSLFITIIFLSVFSLDLSNVALRNFPEI